MLTIPTYKNNTIDALIKSGIKFSGSKDTKNLYIGNITFDNDPSKLIYKAFENFIEFESIEYEKKFQDLINGEDKSMALLAVINTPTVNKKFNPFYVRVLPEAIKALPLSFAVWHGLPYVNDIDIILQRLIRSGIIKHFNNIETKSYYHDIKHHHSRIKLEDLSPAFLILVFLRSSKIGSFSLEFTNDNLSGNFLLLRFGTCVYKSNSFDSELDDFIDNEDNNMEST
ncbi:hypothetical protein HCN44_007513 [Aphidius gifuensis]|uniref:Uncharacterized protein n=1 Tax=Aphidius gifuensis TaxID=684658 RepID=A0A835CKQ2_APHGI|nr:hypothetical protein HCN44_007513 [Aphidius gifuensis]